MSKSRFQQAKMIFDRRNHLREESDNGEVHITAKNFSCTAGVINLSDGGVKIETEKVPPKFERLRIIISSDNRQKAYKEGIVVWFVDKDAPDFGFFVGIKFLKDLDEHEFEDK